MNSFRVPQRVKQIRDQNFGIAYRASKTQRPWDSMSSTFRRSTRSDSRQEKEKTILLQVSLGIRVCRTPLETNSAAIKQLSRSWVRWTISTGWWEKSKPEAWNLHWIS